MSMRPAVPNRYPVTCTNCDLWIALWTKPTKVLCSERCFKEYMGLSLKEYMGLNNVIADVVDAQVKSESICVVKAPSPQPPKVVDVKPLEKVFVGDFTFLPIKEGETYKATVTYMNGFDDIYVHLKEFAKEYAAYEEEIKAYFKGYPISTSREQVGDICFAPFDGEFFRCQILSFDSLNVMANVVFLDHGNLEMIKVKDLFFVPSPFLTKPIHVVRCQWDLAISKEVSEDDLENLLFPYSTGANLKILKKITDGEYLAEFGGKPSKAIFKIAKEGSAGKVEAKAEAKIEKKIESSKVDAPKQKDSKIVVNEANPFLPPTVEKKILSPTTDVPKVTPPIPKKEAEKMVPVKDAQPKPAEEISKKNGIYKIKKLRYSPNIKSGGKVRINYAWAPHSLLIGSTQDDADLGKLAVAIAQYVAEGKGKLTRVPELGEVLLGCYQGEYFRGQIIQLDEIEKKAVIEFIDYGDSTWANYDELFELNKEIAEIPRFGMTIELDDVPRRSKNDLRKLPADVESLLANDMTLQITNNEEPWTAKVWMDDKYTVNALFAKTFN